MRWASIIAAVYVLCVPALLLNRRGRTRGAALLTVAGLWTIVTACTLTAGGTSAIAPWFYVIVVLIAGLFFGARAGAAVSLSVGGHAARRRDPRERRPAALAGPALYADAALARVGDGAQP